MAGIEKLKKVEVFLVEVAKAIKVSLEDGALGIGDLLHFTGAFGALSSAIAALGDVPEELKDLSAEEAIELIEVAVLQFPELPAKSVAVVRSALKVVLAGADFYQVLKG